MRHVIMYVDDIGPPSCVQELGQLEKPVRFEREVTWSQEIDDLLGKVPDIEIAKRYGIHMRAVRARREKLGVEITHMRRYERPVWTEESDRLLGTMYDLEVAAKIGTTPHHVRVRRAELNIDPYVPPDPPVTDNPQVSVRPLTEEEQRMLGTVSDMVLAERWGLKPNAVGKARQALGIPPFISSDEIEWTNAMISMLGKHPDGTVARSCEISHSCVKIKRIEMGILPFGKSVMDREPDLPSEVIRLIGIVPDKQLSDQFKVGRFKIRVYRALHRIPLAEYEVKPQHDWTKDEIALLGTASDRDVACKIGIPVDQVMHRRRKLRIPAFRTIDRVQWTAEKVKLLGKQPDSTLARLWGFSQPIVRAKREELEIAPCPARGRIWTEDEVKLLGTMPDKELGKRLGLSQSGVINKRKELGIPPFKKHGRHEWTEAQLELLGTKTDDELAIEFDLSPQFIREKRISLGIPPLRPSQERWTPEVIAKMGVVSDRQLADELQVSSALVFQKRRALGIPAAKPQR